MKSLIRSWNKLLHMKFNFLSVLTLTLFIMSGGCELINPEETIPARIQVNAPVLEVLPGQGTARHKITEVWIHANSSFIGAYGPPVEVPFITDDPLTDFSFRAGIRNNGIVEDAIIYPMFTDYDLQLNTEPGNVSTVNPVFRYKPEVVFSIVSDFETQMDFGDDRDTVPTSIFFRSSVDPFEGSYSGEMNMTEDAHFIEVGQSIAMTDLPTDGTPAYLEFHYRNEVEMSIGLLGIPLNGPPVSSFFYLLKPRTEWNKIYIELTDILKASGLSSYKILFRSIYPPNATQDSYKIQIDNIKVVHL